MSIRKVVLCDTRQPEVEGSHSHFRLNSPSLELDSAYPLCRPVEVVDLPQLSKERTDLQSRSILHHHGSKLKGK